MTYYFFYTRCIQMGSTQSTVEEQVITSQEIVNLAETATDGPAPNKGIENATLLEIVRELSNQMENGTMNLNETNLRKLAEFLDFGEGFFEYVSRSIPKDKVRQIRLHSKENAKQKFKKMKIKMINMEDKPAAVAGVAVVENYRMPRYERYTMPTSMNLKY
ncbi:hypothetical protein DSLPV1_047 [Dishui lake phycodnavirus 1]|uniref:hypothetical protein n=1 Tax=Dishui lake phycodnavirus 1 TaxID=2079134 RepID=UPI000CD68214|nr:hypothetical protein C5Y57_gp047 [Dishui lake phycodnavirus 1]AUT19018.1 hypothetical protein DSLPV1_047 [Dishui lake phycodnavirus 1]